jgi:hypothetical protein
MNWSAPFLTRLRATLRLLAWCASLAAASASLTGCGPRFVRAPDSPMLILEGRGRLRVAMDDNGTMVEVGWIDAAELEGQTVVQFDWTEE